MSDLSRWTGPVRTEGFRFGTRHAPLVVEVTHVVVEPSEDGPRPTGEVFVRRYVDGVLTEEFHEGATTERGGGRI